MRQSVGAVEDRDEIEVEFVDDRSVVHIINDESLHQNNSLNHIGTPKRFGGDSRNKRTSIKSPKKKQTLDVDNDEEECSENDSDLIQKPKALFEEGDIPGERMFSFHSKQSKSSTSQLSSQKTPTSKKKGGCRDNNEIDHEIRNIQPQVLFDDENDPESKPYKTSTRATTKSTSFLSKNEVLENGSSNGNDNKFGYKTPKKAKIVQTMSSSKNHNCADVVINSTPKTPKSEKYSNSKQVLAKTPRVLRKKIAKGIEQQKFEQLNELNDSDYSIGDSTDENDSDSSIHSNEKPIQIKENSAKNPLRKSTRKKEVPFMYKAEEYFLAKSTKSLKKSKTSDNTLKLLKNPVLDQGQVDKLSGNSNTIHSKNLKTMYKNIVSNFPYWLCLLKEGFNLLLYGFGSKRQIINDFRTAMLEKESTLVINGFFPGLTLKEILESITIDLLDLESCPGSAELAVQLIEETQKLKNAKHIYILIHNLDGVELQNYKTQHAISRICSLKNVHLIASIDRVNAALMYDNTKLGDYNFLWMDCTNYSPYTVETRFIEPLMVKNTGSTHALSGLNNFFKSLTSNAKRILLLIIKNHIENKNNKKHAGVPFSTLYRWCRQQFLVSTDLALRSQLVEFVDHEVVKWKRDADILHVPVDIEVLVQFYKLNEEEDE